MQDLSRIKKINVIKSDLDRAFLSPEALASPPNLSVAVCDVCDIRCPYCPRQYYKDLITPGMVSVEDFKKVAPLLEYANYIELFGAGEPFLHKGFFELVDICKKHGVFVQTSSHGMSLNEKTRRTIIDHKLDSIVVSIDAPKKKLFEFLREGAIFKQVIENIKAIQRLKRELASSTPRICLAVTVSKHNVKHVPAMMKLARKLGVELVDLCNLVVLDEKNAHLDVSGSEYYRRQLKQAQALGEKYGITVTITLQKPFPWKKVDMAPLRGKRFGCPAAWNMLLIEKDGNAKVCCYTDESCGNAFEQDPLSIVNNDKAVEFRRRLMTGEVFECCVGCGLLVEVTDEYVQGTLRFVRNRISSSELDKDAKSELMDAVEKYESLAGKI